MTLRPLVVGLGRAGAGLHLPALARIRRDGSARAVLDDAPPLTFDVCPGRGGGLGAVVDSLAQAASTTSPDRTVVHLCTPPTQRLESFACLAGLGYRRFIVEKPLAVGEADRTAVSVLCRRFRLDVVVMAQWSVSALTDRIDTILRGGCLGAPRSLSIVQDKPRFTRSLASNDHPTVFDVEMPHGVGLALHLAGAATVRAARCDDMTVDGLRLPSMGRARLHLRHASGAGSTLTSDLTAPVCARTLTVKLEHGTVIGHYPVSAADNYAQLTVRVAGDRHRTVFHDDALTAFVLAAYRHFAGSGELAGNLAHNLAVARLLGEAKAEAKAQATARTQTPGQGAGHVR